MSTNTELNSQLTQGLVELNDSDLEAVTGGRGRGQGKSVRIKIRINVGKKRS